MSEKNKILHKLNISENHTMECKLAKGGLPANIWETYSSFANTDGGTIILGVAERGKSFEVVGLSNEQLAKYQKDFWNTINDRNKISRNVLLNHHVGEEEIDGKKVLMIRIPAADRRDKPVYVGTDPMRGTYRRNFEGDYLCNDDEIRAMFSDQRDETEDSKCVENMDISAFDADTVKGYRTLFENLHRTHPWNRLENDEFLLKMTALKKLDSGKLVPTVAGLVVFGCADNIVQVLPNYFLDYREENGQRGVRWLFRITSDDGDWSGNLFDFYSRVINRIDDEVGVPFVNRRNGFRIDETDIHDAIGEAVANALIHANYYGRQGIVIVKRQKNINISNPGTLRITKEELFAGGNSDPRNPIVLKMFNRINVGERAGSGVDKIMTAWQEQGWNTPSFDISLRPERITLELEVGEVVYVQGVHDLRENGEEKRTVEAVDRQKLIIDYLKSHESIKMSEATRLMGYKSRSAARKVIDDMISEGELDKVGSGQETRYILHQG